MTGGALGPACAATIDTSTTPTAASMRPAKGAQYLVCCMSLLLHEAPTTQTRIVNHPDCADKRARRILVLSCRMHGRGCRLALLRPSLGGSRSAGPCACGPPPYAQCAQPCAPARRSRFGGVVGSRVRAAPYDRDAQEGDR